MLVEVADAMASTTGSGDDEVNGSVKSASFRVRHSRTHLACLTASQPAMMSTHNNVQTPAPAGR
jgi:hypothetical protein